MFHLNPQTQPAFGLSELWFKQTTQPSQIEGFRMLLEKKTKKCFIWQDMFQFN